MRPRLTSNRGAMKNVFEQANNNKTEIYNPSFTITKIRVG